MHMHCVVGKIMVSRQPLDGITGMRLYSGQIIGLCAWPRQSTILDKSPWDSLKI